MNLFDKSQGVPRPIDSLQIGENVSWFYRVQEAAKKKTKNGDDFLDLVLMDKSGRLPAKVWNKVEEYHQLIRPGEVYKFSGEVREYRGKMQLTVNHLRAAVPGDPGFAAEDFCETARFDCQALLDETFSLLGDNLSDPFRASSANASGTSTARSSARPMAPRRSTTLTPAGCCSTRTRC